MFIISIIDVYASTSDNDDDDNNGDDDDNDEHFGYVYVSDFCVSVSNYAL